MVSGRSSSAGGSRHFGRGGGQIGRAGGQSSHGESSNGAGAGGNRERTEAEREASDRARVRASYRYLNYGRRPPPAYYRRESTRYSSRRSASTSAPSSSRRSAQPQMQVESSSSRAAQLQVEPQQQVLPGRAADYVDDADLDNVLAALTAEPTITPEDFVGEQYIDGMVELVQQTTVGQEKKEAEHRQIAMEQPFVFLDSDED